MSALRKVAFKLLSVHDAIYQRSGGWIGHRIPFAPPNLLLHSIGAKTGKARTNTLTYAQDAGNYLIVASNAGAKRYPGWYHNLKAHPDVEINVGPTRIAVTAQIVLPDDADYARLWAITNKNNSNRYDSYQERTDRPIAVIVLKPR
ncbi:nitroreductase family deazaflavin-dependent oxidoreductase [Mycolicibacterium komossense]|uniref:Nitroreductase family deazaflavin-dependent oxidoreductase n=1 Tax=Mycolicibacterium komossense TaxID=1779 RepID=A0ABT3CKM7_9MYCO|nr:nitroreductase family deazaflavin-dependent oxidoreductase [Mycolicibacterium komossense]MCV7229801.1 nitroreductase family deazaflavin-dependent oxidoreductase [Mycolicibacterium komossense]